MRYHLIYNRPAEENMVLCQLLFDVVVKEDDYIEISMIIKNVGLTK